MFPPQDKGAAGVEWFCLTAVRGTFEIFAIGGIVSTTRRGGGAKGATGGRDERARGCSYRIFPVASENCCRSRIGPRRERLALELFPLFARPSSRCDAPTPVP